MQGVGGAHADHGAHSSAAAVGTSAAELDQQQDVSRAGKSCSNGSAVAHLRGLSSNIGSPAMSEALAMDAPTAPQREQQGKQPPSPDADGDFGQYNAAAVASHDGPAAGQQAGLQQAPPGSGFATAEPSPAEERGTLPVPAFNLLQPPVSAPAADDSTTGDLAAAAAKPHEDASKLAQLLLQLADLPTDEVLAMLKQVKMAGSTSPSTAAAAAAGKAPQPQQQQQQQQQRQEPPPAPPATQRQQQHQQQGDRHPQRQHSSQQQQQQQLVPPPPPQQQPQRQQSLQQQPQRQHSLQQQQQPSQQQPQRQQQLQQQPQRQQSLQQQQQGAGVAPLSAPLGPRSPIRPPLLAPTLSAQHPAQGQQHNPAAMTGVKFELPQSHDIQAQGLMRQQSGAHAGPMRQQQQRPQQQRLEPPRFIPEPHSTQGQGQGQGLSLQEQLLRLLQQHDQQQQQQPPPAPLQQQQQQPPGPPAAAPFSPSTQDILQVMQSLLAGNTGAGHSSSMAAPAPPPPPPAAAAAGYQVQPRSMYGPVSSGMNGGHMQGAAAGGRVGMAPGGMAGMGPGSSQAPPPAAAAAASAGPPAPAAAPAIDTSEIAALIQQLMAGGQQPAPAPAPAPPPPPPPPPTRVLAPPPLPQLQQQAYQNQQQQEHQQQLESQLQSALAGIPGIPDALHALVAQAIADIAGGSRSGPETDAANTALLHAAKDLLAALTAADPALDNPPAAAAAGGSGGGNLYHGGDTHMPAWDPAAAAAAPRDPLSMPQQHRSSASGRHREGRGSGHGGAYNAASGGVYEAAGDDWDDGSGYGVQEDHNRPSGRWTARRGKGALPPRKGGRGSRGRGPTAADADADGRHNNLFTLLAALDQQEQQDSEGYAAGGRAAYAGGLVDDDGDSCGAAADTAADRAAAAAAPWDGAYSGYGDVESSGGDSDAGYDFDDDYDAGYEEGTGYGGRAGGRRGGGGYRQQYGGNVSPTRKTRGRPKRASSSGAAAAAASEPPTMNALKDQAWLLQQRPSGKRPVKPNTEFAAYVAPLLPQEVLAHEKKYKADHKHGIDNLRAYRQSVVDAKGGRGKEGHHKDSPSAAAAAAPAKDFIDGPNYPRRHLKRRRTSWGWYLLKKGRLQQEQEQGDVTDAAEDYEAAGGSIDASAAAAAAAAAAPEHSGSNGGQPAADGGPSGYTTGVEAGGWGDAGAVEPMAFESMSQAAEAAAAAAAAAGVLDHQDFSDRDVEGSNAAAAAAAAAGPLVAAAAAAGSAAAVAAAAAAAAGGSPGGGDLPGKRQRWVAGTNQWVMEDGVVIWPRDNEVTREQRVFYIAFKWVAKYWPHRVGRDPHIVTLPVSVWLDGQPVNLDLRGKIRLYNKAAHMVISPYSTLAQDHAGKWIKGYGYDPHNKSLRLLVSSEEPGPNSPGSGKVQKARVKRRKLNNVNSASSPRPAAAAAAGQDGPSTISGSVAGPAAASIGGMGPESEPWLDNSMDVETPEAAAAAAAAAAGRDVQVADAAQQQQQQQQQQQSPGGSLVGSGRKRKNNPVGEADPGAPAEMSQEATQAAPSTEFKLPGVEHSWWCPEPLDTTTQQLLTEGYQQQQQQQQQQQAVKQSRPARVAAAGAAAATAAAGARRYFSHSEASKQKAMVRSANSRAAVARRWANYRAQKAAGAGDEDQGARAAAAAAAGEAAAAAAAAAAGGVGTGVDIGASRPVLQLPLLDGRKLASDISTVNVALLSVSDVMKLPEELVMGLSKQIVKALQVAAAATAAAAAGAASVAAMLQDVTGGGGDGQTGGGVGSVQEQLHAALKSWYQQLRGAVSERNGAMVAQLVEELRANVLPAAS